MASATLVRNDRTVAVAIRVQDEPVEPGADRAARRPVDPVKAKQRRLVTVGRQRDIGVEHRKDPPGNSGRLPPHGQHRHGAPPHRLTELHQDQLRQRRHRAHPGEAVRPRLMRLVDERAPQGQAGQPRCRDGGADLSPDLGAHEHACHAIRPARPECRAESHGAGPEGPGAARRPSRPPGRSRSGPHRGPGHRGTWHLDGNEELAADPAGAAGLARWQRRADGSCRPPPGAAGVTTVSRCRAGSLCLLTRPPCRLSGIRSAELRTRRLLRRLT